MADPQFSVEHRAQFQQLLAIGEVHAHNFHPEQKPFGPWVLGSDVRGGEDASERLQKRFQAAARKAAMSAGAPARVGLLDWWICSLAGRKRRSRLEGLVQRSIELCEDLETKSVEGRLPKPAIGTEAGLRRDHYEVDLFPRDRVYDHPHDPLPNPKEEFDYWYEHIWEWFGKPTGLWGGPPSVEVDRQSPDGLIYDLRRRLPGETRVAFRDRVAKNVSDRYEMVEIAFQAVASDLGVLLANYSIDRGFRGDAAAQAFDAEATEVITRMEQEWREKSKRVGLSWRKRRPDFKKALRQIGIDLRALTESHEPDSSPPRRSPKEFIDISRRRPKRSYEKLASYIGIGKDTLYKITKETRWVSDPTYALVAEACGCKPEDLHPRDIPRPEPRLP
jgi:hypothetical protein